MPIVISESYRRNTDENRSRKVRPNLGMFWAVVGRYHEIQEFSSVVSRRETPLGAQAANYLNDPSLAMIFHFVHLPCILRRFPSVG